MFRLGNVLVVLGSTGTIFRERGRMYEGMFEYILFWIYFKVNFDNWTFTIFLQSVWSLQTSPYEIRLQITPRNPSAKCHPCKKNCPPHYHQNISVKAVCSLWYHRLPDHSQAHDFYSKRRLHVRITRKEEAQGVTAFWVRSIHMDNTCIRPLSLKIVALLPRTTKTFPRRNISATLANNFVCCSS